MAASLGMSMILPTRTSMTSPSPLRAQLCTSATWSRDTARTSGGCPRHRPYSATFLSNPWPTASSSERNLGGREKVDELEVDDRDHGMDIAHGTWRVEQ
jgi:hypothetical protein